MIETTGNGTDAVDSTAPNFILPNHVENLNLGGGIAIRGTGNLQNNTIAGNTVALDPVRDLGRLGGNSGFKIAGAADGDDADVSVAIGRIDGDAFADIAIGAPGSGPGGAAFVVHGKTSVTMVDLGNTGGGNDIMLLQTSNPTAFQVANGGPGVDTIVFTGAGTTLNLAGKGGRKIVGFEAFDLTGTGTTP
ncbi:MAG: hypothetical protein EXQ94_10165 [Alphaproteobacteria bacterium]|nr:hypothetical protein [Alphaproteobacteria bacterium]